MDSYTKELVGRSGPDTQRVQEEVYQAVTETEAVVTGEGMEETLVGKSSLGESSSKAETGEEEPGEVQGDPDNLFTGLS